MLNLDSISFTADTSQLDLAAKKIEALGTAISALSVDLGKLDRATSTAAKSQADSAKAASTAAKAEEELGAAKTANERVTKSTTASTDAATRAVEKQTLAMKIFRGEAVGLNDEVLTLGTSFTKGQSSQLAGLKLLGATTDQMKVLAGSFEDFNKITSANTFDNSAAGLGKLSKEIFELTKVNDLMKRGIALTRDEIVNLVRDSERLTQQFKSEGLSAQQTVQALGGLEAQTIKLAKEKNELISRTKASELAAKTEANAIEKASADAAKANQFLAREMQRVDNVLAGFNDKLNITSSNRLLKFREQLKASGADAGTAEKMLKVYEERLRTINTTSQGNAKAGREEELKYLARATSVQLGDIGISLAGGQNPLLVLIQQGDQLRGVLNQVGASGGEMQKALSMAFSQIVVGSKDVVVALGSFVVGAFADAGKAVTRFGASLFGIDKAMDFIKADLFARWASEGEAGFSKIGKAMKVAELAMTGFGIALGVAFALMTATTVAAVQMMNAQDGLVRSLVSSGASLGVTSNEAQNLAKSLNVTGSSTVDVITAFSKIADVGGITKNSMLLIADAALTLENASGRAADKTIEMFAKLGDKPVETLNEYAQKTGLVTIAELERVEALVKLGNEIDATKVATEILAAATKNEAKNILANLSPISLLWIDIKNSTNDAWGAVQNFGSSGSAFKPFMDVLREVGVLIQMAFYGITSLIRLLTSYATMAISIGGAIKDVVSGNISVSEGLDRIKNQAKAIVDVEKDRLAGYNDIGDKLRAQGKYSEESREAALKGIAKETQANSEAAKAKEENEKGMKKWKDLAEKDQIKTLTREQYIKHEVEQTNKARAQNNALVGEQLKLVQALAGKEYDQANKPKKVPKSDAMKGAEDDAKWYRTAIERIDDLKNQTIGAIEQLTKAQVLLKDLADDDSFKKLSAQQQMRLVDRINEIDLLEQTLNLQKEQAKAEKELTKIREDNTKFLDKEKQEQSKILQDSELKLALLGKTQEEQFAITESMELQNKILAVTLRYESQRNKLKADYAKLNDADPLTRFKAGNEYEEELRKLREQEQAMIDSLMQASANKFEANFAQKILNVTKTLSEAITTALFEGGQAGTKKLKDYIVGIFREKINVQINTIITSAVGGLFGSGSGSSGTSGASSGGILSSLFGGSSGGGIMSTLGSLFTGTGTGIAATTSATLGGTAIGGSAGIGSGTILGGGAASAGAGIGSSILSGVSTVAPWIAGAMLVKDLTGYKLQDKGNGLTATIGGANGLPSGSAGRYNLVEQTSGMGKTTTNGHWSVAEEKINTYISKNVQAITKANKLYGDSLGLTTDSITNFTKTFDINTTGMDAAAQQAAIDAELVKFSAEQIQATYGDALKGVAREGESTSQTLTRLRTDLSGINSMFGDLGYTLFDVSVTGANAASTLANAFGGLAAAQSQLNSYYENFYTQQEQQDNVYSAVQTDLKRVGIDYSIDQLKSANKTDIRSTVDLLAGDVGTEAGANKYAAAVKAANKLSGFKSFAEKTTTPTTSSSEQFGSSGGGGGGGSGDKAADAIANAWQAIVDSIWGEVKRVRELLNGTGKDALAEAKAQFEKATTLARTGDQEAAKALPELSKVMLTLAQGQASTLIELRRSQALTANSLEQTATGLAGQYGLTVPTFASGGMYEGGMALVGEQGPELINFNQGGYVNTASQTSAMFSTNNGLSDGLKVLNDKVSQLEAAAISTAISTKKIQKILERVSPDGNTIAISGTVTAI